MDADIRPRRARGKAKPASRKKPAAKPASDTTSRKLMRAEMLLDITRELAGTDNLNDVLVKMVEITARETDCERATLFLNDDQTGELYSRVAQGEGNREAANRFNDSEQKFVNSADGKAKIKKGPQVRPEEQTELEKAEAVTRAKGKTDPEI